MRSAIFVICMAMAGFASAKSAEIVQIPSELVATHGYALATFPKGGGQPLTVQRVDGGKEETLDTSPSSVIGTEIYGRWLSPGKYRVMRWGLNKWTDDQTFEVQVGRITELGGLIPVNIGGYETVILPTHAAENIGLTQRASSEFASLLADPQPLAWQPATLPKPIANQSPGGTGLMAAGSGALVSGQGLIVDLLLDYDRKINKPSTVARLKSAQTVDEFISIERTIVPPLYDKPAHDTNGTLFFPANFGQIRIRDAHGNWSSVGMDTLHSIMSVEYDEGRLLAGSDNGHVRLSNDNGLHWSELRSFGSVESITGIDHADGIWIVSTSEAYDDPNAPRSGGMLAALPGTRSLKLRVYLGHQSDLSDLVLSKEFDLTPKDQILWSGARGQLVGHRYYITVAQTLQRLDLDSGQWANVSPPAKVGSHHVDPDTGVITALWAQGVFSKVFVSSDHGANWTQIGRPPYVINDVQMDTVDHGWASRWNMNAFSGTWETYDFAPAKNDWVKSGEAPFNCKLLRVSPQTPVLCISNDASIFSQINGVWNVEFSAQ